MLTRLEPLAAHLQGADADASFLGTAPPDATARGVAYGYLHPEAPHAPFEAPVAQPARKVCAASATCIVAQLLTVAQEAWLAAGLQPYTPQLSNKTSSVAAVWWLTLIYTRVW